MNKPLALVLAIVGALAIIVGILWFVGVAPSFLNVGSHVKSGGHLFRGGAAVVVGLVALFGARVVSKKAAA